MLGRNEKVQYLATGSEDGSIRVLKYDTANHKFFPLHRNNNHTSSVRVLVSVKIDQNHVLLLSGGGRSEVYATVIGK
jgi:WD40 repeat protein